jgi:hypothetical protein
MYLLRVTQANPLAGAYGRLAISTQNHPRISPSRKPAARSCRVALPANEVHAGSELTQRAVTACAHRLFGDRSQHAYPVAEVHDESVDLRRTLSRVRRDKGAAHARGACAGLRKRSLVRPAAVPPFPPMR